MRHLSATIADERGCLRVIYVIVRTHVLCVSNISVVCVLDARLFALNAETADWTRNRECPPGFELVVCSGSSADAAAPGWQRAGCNKNVDVGGRGEIFTIPLDENLFLLDENLFH